jgi:cysteine desulfurase/selenocysteine lyase
MSTLRNIRDQFPIFSRRPELVYLDNAATSQKPASVIDAMNDFYLNDNANVHRGLYDLSATATRRYEGVRSKVAAMIGAADGKQIAFTKGATESINFIAQGFLRRRLKPGDQVVTTAMEHHANFIPWQQVCKERNCKLVVLPVNEDGDLQVEALDALLTSNTRLLAVAHISNALGTINPIEEIIAKANKKNIPILVDAAQSAGHYPINVAQLNTDFLVFSGHKMFGPLGTGVLYSRSDHTSDIAPTLYGGGIIKSVSPDDTQFLEYPYCLEAGTPNVAGVLGLGIAIDFVARIDNHEASSHTEGLAHRFKEKLAALPGFRVVGNSKKQGPIVSFISKNIHPHDIASFLGQANVAVRAGHHCAQPLMEALNLPATTRASFSIYNTDEDVDKAIEALANLTKFWS